MKRWLERLYWRLSPKAKERAIQRANIAESQLLRRRGAPQGVTFASATGEDLRLAASYNMRQAEKLLRQRPKLSREKRRLIEERRATWLHEIAGLLGPGEIVWDLPKRVRNRVLDEANDVGSLDV